jgi:hypothetical protein
VRTDNTPTKGNLVNQHMAAAPRLASVLTPTDVAATESRYTIPEALPAYIPPKTVDPSEIYDGDVRNTCRVLYVPTEQLASTLLPLAVVYVPSDMI